jgi:MFS family permease
VFPLLFVVTAVAFMALAVPVGRLADRVGGVPVLLSGYAMLLPVYWLLLSPSGTVGLVFALLAMGAYFAATEGVATAIAGAILPDLLQGTGIGILITVTSIGQFASSLLFGALWFAVGLETAVLAFAIALLLALATATPSMLRMRLEPAG